jgi:hypothetical protein
MSTPSLSQQPAHPSSVLSLQLALQPLVQYEERLKSIADLGQSALLSHIQAKKLRSLCGRVRKLDIPTIATHLSEIKAAGALSLRETEVLSSLETLVTQAATDGNGKKSCNLMIQNLDLVISTFDALAGTAHAVATSDEGTRLPFPEAAASLALFVLKRDGTCTKRPRGSLGSGSYGSVSEIFVAGSVYAEKKASDVSGRETLHSGAAKAYQIASRHLVKIAAVTHQTVVMEKGVMTLSAAFDNHRASHISHTPRYIREMIQGLVDIHRAGFVLRDIKKSNMVLVPGDHLGDSLSLKYIDYDSLVPIGSRAIPTCTPGHHSPELAKICLELPIDHTGGVDVELPVVCLADDAWALGVAIFQILSDKTWFRDPPKTPLILLFQTLNLKPNEVSEAISAIEADEELKAALGDQLLHLTTTLRILLDFDPEKRATAVERALTYLSEMQDADLASLRLSTSSATLVDSAVVSDRSPIETPSPAGSSASASYTGLRMEGDRVLSVHALERPLAAELPLASSPGLLSPELGIASASPRSEVPHLGGAALSAQAGAEQIEAQAMRTPPLPPLAHRVRIDHLARQRPVGHVTASSESGPSIRLSAGALARQEARKAVK